jgi:hypothetical protein
MTFEDLDDCVRQMRDLCREDWGVDSDEMVLRYMAAAMIRLTRAASSGYMRAGLDLTKAGRSAEIEALRERLAALGPDEAPPR